MNSKKSLNSKTTSSLGVPLSNIRPMNTTISSIQPTASSMVIGMDVASMYPNSVTYNNSSGSWGSNSLIEFPYLVSKEAPFNLRILSKSEVRNIQSNFSEMIDIMGEYDGYGSRLEAEQQRIKKLIDITKDTDEVKALEKALENIEIDHPEWLI